MANPQYKQFPKGDARRYFSILLAIHRLKERATIHYVAQDVDCNRMDVLRALEVLATQYWVRFDREGFTYQITSWGVLQRKVLIEFLNTN